MSGSGRDALYTRAAMVLCGVGVVLAYAVAVRVFDRIPHLEDEFAYYWQAQVFRAGQTKVPSPPEAPSFLVPFVVDYQGYRFSKYPPGWSVLLSLGVALGIPFWVNPLLTGVALGLTYRLGARLWSPGVGLLATALMLTSPFLWMQAGTLLAHMSTLVYAGAWALGWWWALDPNASARRWAWTLIGLAGALLVLTRPWTALAVMAPYGIVAVWGLWRRRCSLRALGYVALWVLLGGLLVLAWQTVVTGDPFLNPYTLWWPYDRVGFGPGHGVLPEGHTLEQAWINTRFTLEVARADVLGWFTVSWLFLPLGLWDLRKRSPHAWALALVFPSLVVFYMAYWVGSWLLGPRYYFEGLYGWMLLTAAGIAGLARGLDRWLLRRSIRWGTVLVGTVVGVLVALNVWGYLPRRLAMLENLYGISRAPWSLFLERMAPPFTPGLVLVDADHWTQYGALIPLEDPWLSTPWIFAWSRSPQIDARVVGCFPQRRAWVYRPERGVLEPWRGDPAPCPREPLGVEGLKHNAGQAPRRRPETSP